VGRTGSKASQARHDESPAERADRNWNDLLQELRVAQTGTQVLTAFLLTLPFQQRFTELDTFQVRTYIVVVLLSASATGLLVAPASLHRGLFQEGRKAEVVSWGHRLATAGMAVLAGAVSGVVLLVFSVVLGRDAGFVSSLCVLLVLLGLWFVLPVAIRHSGSRVAD